MRGRHGANLYHQGEFREAILSRSVGEVRNELGLDQPPPTARVSDVLAFVAWSVGAILLQLWPLALIAWWAFG